jgi:hypothetical protein
MELAMSNLDLTMLVLPLVFMVHEYEEIIMFEPWLRSNREELRRRFPRFAQFFERSGYFDYSTSTFAIGTAHEFLLVAIISTLAVWQGVYAWWFAAFSAHFVHLIIHFIQWIVYRKYVPVIVSTILSLSLPYCLPALSEFIHASLLSPSQICLWGLIGIVGMVLSVCSASFIMAKVHRTSSRM